MGFKVQPAQTTQSEGGSYEKVEVDYDGMNAHVIEAAGTQSKPRTIVGFVSEYYDLGLQEQPDFEELYKGDEKQEKQLSEGKSELKKVDKFYDNGTCHSNVQIVVTKRPPKPSCTFAVRFPQITVDKGQFFGESRPEPLRMVLGGEFYMFPKDSKQGDKKEKVLQRVIPLQENTKNKLNKWAFGATSLPAKMAAAADLLDSDGLFSGKGRLTELLGKPMMFQIQIFKNADGFYNERISFKGAIPEGLPIPDGWDDKWIAGVNMSVENDLETVKNLPYHVKNTIKRALDFEGSVLQSEMNKIVEEFKQSQSSKSDGVGSSGSDGNEPAQSKPTPVKSTPAPSYGVDDMTFDDDQ